MEARKKFIIMESQDNLRELLSFYIESHFNFEPVKCSNVVDVSKHLKEPNVALVLIGMGKFKDDHIVLRSMMQKEDMRGIVNFDLTSLRTDFTGVGALVARKIFLEVVDKLTAVFSIDPNKEPKEYSAISISTLPFLKEVGSDLYIELPTGRHIKLFRNDDLIDLADTQKYADKGVKYLYLNRKSYTWIIKNLEDSISRVFENSDFKVSKNMDNLLSDLGVPKEFYDSLVEKAFDVKKEINANNNLKALFKKLSADRSTEAFFEERIRLVSSIACGIAKELNWGSDTTYKKIILAAHLHDIVLMPNVALASIRSIGEFAAKKDQFSPEDARLFLNHPAMICKILELDSTIPTDTITMISQHHEECDGRGFPNKINHQRIMPFSALFNVSLDLATYILNDKDWDIDTFIIMKSDQYRGTAYRNITRQLSLFKKSRIQVNPNAA